MNKSSMIIAPSANTTAKTPTPCDAPIFVKSRILRLVAQKVRDKFAEVVETAAMNVADQGEYLASESSFYRILRADGQQHHRGRAKAPTRRKPPTSYQATGPCQVWTCCPVGDCMQSP